jgi:DNA polymerase III gamma/tau subunit
MTEKNAENERALASFAKWSAGAMRENSSSMDEIERVTTEMTDRLGAVSEKHLRDAFEAEARSAEATNAARAAVMFDKAEDADGKSP